MTSFPRCTIVRSLQSSACTRLALVKAGNRPIDRSGEQPDEMMSFGSGFAGWVSAAGALMPTEGAVGCKPQT